MGMSISAGLWTASDVARAAGVNRQYMEAVIRRGYLPRPTHRLSGGLRMHYSDDEAAAAVALLRKLKEAK